MPTKFGSQQKQSPEDNTGGGRTDTSASRYNHNTFGLVPTVARGAVRAQRKALRTLVEGTVGPVITAFGSPPSTLAVELVYIETRMRLIAADHATRKPARADPNTLGSAPSSCVCACVLFVY